MSILIKGMEMPKDCLFCPMAHWNKLDRITGCEVVGGKRYVDETDDEFWKTDKRPSWCPLVEVPTPHGRLIDVDKLEVVGLKEYEDAQKVAFAINNAPTVIEAEVKE